MSKNNILEDLKKIEDTSNKELLIKTLKELKAKAKEVYKLKLETQSWLDLFDLTPEDKKSIIDWINNLPDVKLSEEEKNEIKKQIEKKFKIIKEQKEEEKSNSWIEDYLKKRKELFPQIWWNPIQLPSSPLKPNPYDITFNVPPSVNSYDLRNELLNTTNLKDKTLTITLWNGWILN